MTLKQTIEKAGKDIRAAVAPGPAGDILDTLHQEHEQVQGLLEKLTGSDDAAERRELLTQVKAVLVPHSRAEEKIVYDRLLELKGEKVKVDGHEGFLEHQAADQMLVNLDKIARANSAEFTAAAKVLKELLAHHIGEEERDIWADVKKNFSDQQRVAMTEEFEAAKKRVKIPH